MARAAAILVSSSIISIFFMFCSLLVRLVVTGPAKFNLQRSHARRVQSFARLRYHWIARGAWSLDFLEAQTRRCCLCAARFPQRSFRRATEPVRGRDRAQAPLPARWWHHRL